MANKRMTVVPALLAFLTLGGCASINDCCYEHTQTARAFSEYISCGNPECSDFPHDYKKGWMDGFYEVATGGSTCPPAVAPAKYWKPGQVLKDCDNRRHAYYSGWQDGASRAGQFPDTHYLRLYETCECPFPRCDKPCSDGTCGPCGTPYLGMPISNEMIEYTPAAAPAFETMNVAPIGTHNEADTKEHDQDLDNEKVPNAPEPKSNSDASDFELVRPVREVAGNAAAIETEATLVSSKSAGQTIRVEPKPEAGLIRFCEPAKPGMKVNAKEDAMSPIAVARPVSHFEMIEVDPIVKLAD